MLTDKPFGINLTVLPAINPPPYDEYRDVIIDSGIQIVESAGASPTPHLPVFRANRVKLLHKCDAAASTISYPRKT